MNKTKTLTAYATILVLIFAATLVALPTVSAHDPPWQVPTWAYLSVAPNPVGAHQTVFVNFWIDKVPPTANSAYGDRWQNYTVQITKPDGSTETLGPFTSDSAGGAWTTYVPDMVGTYTFVFTFPGQTIMGANPHPIFGTSSPESIGDYYLPSTSSEVTLTVQEEPIESPQVVPLPTEYWTRPIPSLNSEWYKVSGNWLGLAPSTFAATGMYNHTGNFNPYTKAPNTAHVMWTRTLGFGGLIGGEFGGSQTANYYSTSQYEPKFAPIIINGVLYYTEYVGSSTYPAGWRAVDLRTGKTIWTKNITTPLSCGQIYNYVSPNQYGALAYLWTMPSGFFGGAGTYSMYDANTGNHILDIENGTRATIVEAPDGSLLGYYVNRTDNTLNMWNSSKCILDSFAPNPFYQEPRWMWRPQVGSKIPFSLGIQWTTPVPTEIDGTPIIPALNIDKIGSNVIVLTARAGGFGFSTGYQIEAGYNQTTGELLWGPINRTIPYQTAYRLGPAMNGVYTAYVRETMEWYGFNLTTGEQIWGPVRSETNAWGYYGFQYVAAYGNIYAWDYGGTVNCYDIRTGELRWTWNTGPSGYETPYGIWPLWTFTVGTVADGKLYVPEGHMYSPPLFHGAKQLCLNTTTGELIWSMLAFDTTSAPAISDGYMVTINAYDNQIYCWGKGPTETTVTAPQTAIQRGSSLIIRGTVMDVSAGAKQEGVRERFPSGLPAVSDEDMSAWMEYVYLQQPCPDDVTGVRVHITAIDPNGNFQDIGYATTDMNGNFGIAWTPPVPGTYHVTATFEGSESYWPSDATTYFLVEEAPAAAQPIEPEQPTAPTAPEQPETPTEPEVPEAPTEPEQPAAEGEFITIEGAVIFVVVVACLIGVASYWALRKRK